MKWIVGIFIVILLLSACSSTEKKTLHLPSDDLVKQAFKPSPPGDIQQHSGQKESGYDINDILFSDVIPGIGAGNQFGDGPWNHRIIGADSVNGRVWTRKPKIVAEQGSKPDALVDHEGSVRVYYIDAKNNDVTVALWHQDRWLYKRVGIENGVTDLSAVDAGETYRIYYQIGDSIFSAASTNGVYFDREEGVRYSGTLNGFDVFKTGSGWKMIFSQNGTLYSTESSDGKIFGIAQELGLPGDEPDVLSANGIFTVYYSAPYAGQTAIYSASSLDGITWKQDSGIRLFGGSRLDKKGLFGPTVVNVDQNNYQMYYYSKIG